MNRSASGKSSNPNQRSLKKLLQEGQDCLDKGDYSRARERFLLALKQVPDELRALSCLGWVCQVLGDIDHACQYYERAIKQKDCRAEVWNNLGFLYSERGLRGEAESCFRRALEIRPMMHDASVNLGRLLLTQGRPGEAIEVYNVALPASPKPDSIHYSLGVALRSVGKSGLAMVHLEEALKINPSYAQAHNLLGVVLMEMGMGEEALPCFQEAIRLAPKDDGAYSNLSSLMQSMGRYEEAFELAKTAIELKPDKATIHSSFLFLMNYQESLSREDIFAEQRRWNQRHAVPLGSSICPRTKPRSDKKLRIGYVSPDFRLHPVCFFITPILLGFDRNHFEVFCYANVLNPDQQTETLKKMPTKWRDICGVSDEEVARLIRDDEIDILVDLAGHSGENRLLVFARKPAPVQITYLGNPDGTGMDAMGFRITDSWCDPPGLTERYHSETLLRLDGNFFCYAPPSLSPDVGSLPALKNGHITFGSFNNFSKISKNLLKTWAEILRAVPNSRLLLQSKPLADPAKVTELKAFFAEQGVVEKRILTRGFMSFTEHLQLIDSVDIALDTFPWNGHTTTCHTLWMGVPVIVLAGERCIARMGVSIMEGLGESQLVARNVDEYVEKAVMLADDQARMTSFRESVRSRILNSPWGDHKQFNQKLDTLYRDVWRQYCEGRGE